MRITLQSTDQIHVLDGVPCRLWSGSTAKGTTIIAYIHRLQCHADDDAELAAELDEQPAPECVTPPLGDPMVGRIMRQATKGVPEYD
jgi:hypothetical protein